MLLYICIFNLVLPLSHLLWLQLGCPHLPLPVCGCSKLKKNQVHVAKTCLGCECCGGLQAQNVGLGGCCHLLHGPKQGSTQTGLAPSCTWEVPLKPVAFPGRACWAFSTGSLPWELCCLAALQLRADVGELVWFGWMGTSRVGKEGLVPMLLSCCLGSAFCKGA